MSGGSSSPAPHQGLWLLRAHPYVYFLVQCRIPARSRTEAACTTAGRTAPGLTVTAEWASCWQKTEKPVKVNSPTRISSGGESLHRFHVKDVNRPFGLASSASAACFLSQTSTSARPKPATVRTAATTRWALTCACATRPTSWVLMENSATVRSLS